MVAFELEHKDLAALKDAFHAVADRYICSKAESSIRLNELLFVTDPDCPWRLEAQTALKGLEGLIIAYRRMTCNDYGLLSIANEPTGSLRADARYAKLKFAQSNAWTYLLSKHTSSSDAADGPNDAFEPIPLVPEEVYAYISLMNAGLTKEEKIGILQEVAAYKHWFGK